MLITVFTWLVEQQILLSFILLSLILLERFGLKLIGPSFVYKLFLTLPLALLLNNLPDTLKPIQNSQISYYLVSPNSAYLYDGGWIWAYVYLALAATLLIGATIVHTRFTNKLQLRQIGLPLALDKNINVGTFISPNINSPMVIGFFRSKLVLPANFKEQFSENSLALMLEHESFHIRRKDNLSNAVFLLFTILVFFNPLAWFAYGSFRRLQELSCDQEVLKNKSREQQLLYSKALISCAANAPTAFMAYSHYGDKKMMIQRLTHITAGAKSSKIAKAALLLVAAAMLSTVAIAKSPTSSKSEAEHIAPTLRIDPIYPDHAAQQGLSGSVVLKYDILPSGNTTNISVVSDTPKGVFNREAKKALAKWEYKESAQGHQNQLVQLDFAIDNEIASVPQVEQVKIVK